tara:strand:- start:740 stop:1036 length:297 start_codon:yes stop_codon:yes gene_type:complete
MGFSLSEGLQWLLEGNDLDVCYAERKNDGDIEVPICFDLTGTDYVGIITSPEFVLSTFVCFLYIYATVLYIMSYKRLSRAKSEQRRKQRRIRFSVYER